MIGNYIDGLIEGVKVGVKQGIIDGMKEGLIKLLTWIGTSILNGSYWLCIALAIIALIAYITGYKKAGKYVGISFLVYFILQSIKVVLI